MTLGRDVGFGWENVWMDNDQADAGGATPVADVRARSAVAGEHARAVRAMFDRISLTYDALNRALSLGIDARWRRAAVRALLENLPPGELLDLCAGTLDLSAEVCRQDETRKVHAVDFSASMLARGARKVDPARVRTHVADVCALPFAAGTFAGALVGFGVRNLADPARALEAWRRVLVPSGRLVTLEFFRPTRVLSIALHRAYNSTLVPLVGGALSGERGAYAYLARSMEGFLSRVEYEALLAAHGFRVLEGRDLFPGGVASLVVAETCGDAP